MSQYPPAPMDPGSPSFPSGPGPAPYQQPTSGGGSRVWIWVLGAVGLLSLTPCLCCLGPCAYMATFKEFELSNGRHNGGNPMNVQFDYHIKGDGRGPSKAYFIVCRTADGVVREQNIRGPFIDTRGSFRFFAGGDIGPNARGPVQVWIESESGFGPGGGSRSVSSNTLTIDTKSS